PADIPAVRQESSYDVLFEHRADDGAGAKKLLVINYGALVGQSRAAAEAAKSKGWEVAVVDPHWVYPVSEELVQLAGAADLVVTVEDNGIHGGAGSALQRSEEHTSELQSRFDLVCRLLLEK